MTEVMKNFDCIVLTIAGSIMMMGMMLCDERFHGALRSKRAWSIEITGVWEHFDDKGMEHFDEKVMEHSDDLCHGAF